MTPEHEIDIALDGELRDLLDVDPSPHFVSRVRARVADQSRRGAFRFGWALVPAAAALTAVLSFVLWPALGNNTPTALLSSRAFAIGVSPLPVGSSGRTERVLDVSRSAAEEFSIALTIAPRKYDVIIDPAESAALMRLVANGGAPAQDTRIAAAAPRALDALTPLDPIDIQAVADIQPLVIEPLAADEGVFQ